jgi:uncharacterized Rmd1/YagE family protein
VGEYCELPDRIELVNARIALMQSMLHVWGKHQNHIHMTRLDRVVVLLVALEVLLAALQVVGFLTAPAGAPWQGMGGQGGPR